MIHSCIFSMYMYCSSGENLLNETSLQMYTVVTMATVFTQAKVNC